MKSNEEMRELMVEMLKKGKVSFSFKKKDGTTRSALGTLHPDFLPRQNLSEEQAAVQQAAAEKFKATNPTMVRYWDLGVSAFRTVDVGTLLGYPEVAE